MRTTFLLLALVLIPAEALADSFYMASGAAQVLYLVDDQTGEATPQFDLPVTAWFGLTDVPGDTSTLYAISGVDDYRLSKLDLTLEQVTDFPVLHPADMGLTILNTVFGVTVDPAEPDVALVPVQGRIRGQGEVDGIVRIDLATGLPLGPIELFDILPPDFNRIGELEFDPSGSVLYAAVSVEVLSTHVLGTVDLAGHGVTAFPPAPFSSNHVLGLSARSDGTLIAVLGLGGDDVFVEVDPLTGEYSSPIATMSVFPGPITYILPEPTTGWLVILGLAGSIALGRDPWRRDPPRGLRGRLAGIATRSPPV